MKKNRFHLPLAFTLVLALSFSSCIGPFNATTRLHTWNREIEGPWTAEAVFLPLRFLFVYPAFFVGDVLIFNSIEFWGWKNPIDPVNPERLKALREKDAAAAKAADAK